MKSLRKEWYEQATPEEVAAAKRAMVSGAGGIATHSGHWYNCSNGPCTYGTVRVNLMLTCDASLQSASAVCQWRKLAVRNVVSLLVVRITVLLMVLFVRRIWSENFRLYDGGSCVGSCLLMLAMGLQTM
jgi:hypothetical protein